MGRPLRDLCEPSWAVGIVCSENPGLVASATPGVKQLAVAPFGGGSDRRLLVSGGSWVFLGCCVWPGGGVFVWFLTFPGVSSNPTVKVITEGDNQNRGGGGG